MLRIAIIFAILAFTPGCVVLEQLGMIAGSGTPSDKQLVKFNLDGSQYPGNANGRKF